MSLILNQDSLQKSSHNSSAVLGFRGENLVKHPNIKCTVYLNILITETYPMSHVTATVVGGS